MLGKNGLHIRIQQDKSYQIVELFFLGFEKVLKMQASVCNWGKFFWDVFCIGGYFVLGSICLG